MCRQITMESDSLRISSRPAPASDTNPPSNKRFIILKRLTQDNAAGILKYYIQKNMSHHFNTHKIILVLRNPPLNWMQWNRFCSWGRLRSNFSPSKFASQDFPGLWFYSDVCANLASSEFLLLNTFNLTWEFRYILKKKHIVEVLLCYYLELSLSFCNWWHNLTHFIK